MICSIRLGIFFQHLAATRTYANLDVPLCDILGSIHDQNTHRLATCKKTDQLFELMDKFVTREVSRTFHSSVGRTKEIVSGTSIDYY